MRVRLNAIGDMSDMSDMSDTSDIGDIGDIANTWISSLPIASTRSAGSQVW